MPQLSHLVKPNRYKKQIFQYANLSRYTSSAILSKPSENYSQHQQISRAKLVSNNETQNNMRQPYLISLIQSCTQKSHLLQIHAHLICTSLLHNPAISLRFLSRVSLPPFQEILYSRRILSQIRNPSLFQCNTIIRAYSMSACPIEGFYLYQEMRRQDLRADAFSLSSLIKCFSRLCSLVGGEQVHAMILRDGHRSDGLLLTNLMDLYSICGKRCEMQKVFDEMPRRDTVAYNVFISCCIRSRMTRDVLGMFHGMASGEMGCEPDDVTCLLLLQACANLGALEFGEKVHAYIVECGYDGAMNMCNSLIAMYSRCGSLDKAYGVFRQMRETNVVTWSALICGFAMNGNGREAIGMFQEMLRMGVLPDDQTFTGVLSACSHCGLVDEGMLLFDRMSREFGIETNIHHYGCVVDLLGRAGQLDRAYQLIMSMKVEPDSTIWRTLLGACRIHHQASLGERVIEHIIELKAQEAGDYVLLLNIYSSVGNWEKVKELRRFMKDRGIQTAPGCSSIELKGQVHEFVVDDILHPRKVEIYEKLDEINQQLKIAGYVPEMASELHKLDTEQKTYALSYHSEKLAIAFGVLATPPNTTIRIAKNLRICIDCHNFAKLVSDVYNRQLIIRDRTRFHHFRNGNCSCNDYW